jgi:serine/threonine-protein kinase
VIAAYPSNVTRIAGTPDLHLGDRLGPYLLESVLGEGAIGVVFRAMSAGDRVVALKVLKKLLSRNAVYVQRFLREVRVAQDVSNPHLVAIFETGEAEGYRYLASEYIAGGSLEDLITAQGALPLAQCIPLTAEIASGLDALHASGIVHRDIKPSNVMLTESRGAALTDFGLATGPAYTVLTRTGQVLGTLDYIAPELIRGEEASPACDLYSLGCLVYECLAGDPPFGSRRVFEVAAAHLDESPPPLSERCADVSPALAGVVSGAMSKDPEERPRTATAFANLFRAAASAT